MGQRFRQIEGWLQNTLGTEHFGLQPASADASFRRYLRVTVEERTYIVMDAPPSKEDCRPFIDLSNRLSRAGLNVPRILQTDVQRGFLLLTDLGEDLYLDCLEDANADRLYGDAIEALLTMQLRAEREGLPAYDATLLYGEMELFRDWLLKTHLRVSLPRKQHAALDRMLSVLVDSALAQSPTFVHRDYHSRNLIWSKDNNPGILDFQGAVVGPITYDLVSLLRDCYIKWPEQRVEKWSMEYFSKARSAGLMPQVDDKQFTYWFDLMGIQRHLKASGIFTRLYHRDGKPGYLKDIPRTLNYITEVSGRYTALEGLCEFLTEFVLPRLDGNSA